MDYQERKKQAYEKMEEALKSLSYARKQKIEAEQVLRDAANLTYSKECYFQKTLSEWSNMITECDVQESVTDK